MYASCSLQLDLALEFSQKILLNMKGIITEFTFYHKQLEDIKYDGANLCYLCDVLEIM